ncbi:hypothetical protein KSP39_PZI003672 [Platanthera zijinensis]|uniref:Late embryogenesis abundant protein LEA-2 subgroup domain-containing protein n=1 Tax=Platanthera zijinensis TaxID=2320716 RepID=A0AAP0GBX6_9ASPA
MKHCCLFFVLLVFILLLSSSILLVLLILKPKKPTFHLNSVHLNHMKLDASSGKGIILQPSLASLRFVAQNSNKFGIRYKAANFAMIYENNPVGVVEIPGFYQPPNRTDVALIMHVLLQRVNISRFISEKMEFNGGSPSKSAHIEVQIVGSIRARIHVVSFSFPFIKVCVDCRIQLDFGAETFRRGVTFVKTREALVLSKFPHLSQKCSLDVCL